MKKLVLLAREITQKEIELGIGKEHSSTRLFPIFKTIDLKIPIKNGKKFEPSIPIEPFQGTPLVLIPLLYLPHQESLLFATPSIIEAIKPHEIKPNKIIQDPGKGTGSPIIAAAIESNDDDILIQSPSDQYQTHHVRDAVEEIIKKMEDQGFTSGTVLTTGTKNPAFSYIKVKGEKAIEFMLKGTIPKDDMIAETMIVCCRAGYLKKQILGMKNASIDDLTKIYPYDKDELKKIKQTLADICELMTSCKTSEEFLQKCPFCDFSKIIHRLLIPNMTYATVEYQTEWDDLGDWIKVYNSHVFPKDVNGNIILSKPDLISYKNCRNSVIANYSNQKVIISDLNERIFAIGPRGTIELSINFDPAEFKKDVVEIQKQP